MIKDIQLVTGINVKATLLAIPIGQTVYCPHNTIRENVLRSTASRLHRMGAGNFRIETFGDGVQISRK